MSLQPPPPLDRSPSAGLRAGFDARFDTPFHTGFGLFGASQDARLGDAPSGGTHIFFSTLSLTQEWHSRESVIYSSTSHGRRARTLAMDVPVWPVTEI